ncbi:MAG: tetratricopeptide repeat protein [Acidobacteria bacterium]|nr:tetratricopeptide repeat protein [Acidobacteriota bacterium]
MNRSWGMWFLSATVVVAVLTFWTQAGSAMGKKTWRISGRVLSLQGEPLSGVRIELQAEGAAKDQRIVETNAKGEFQIQITAATSRMTRLQGVLAASKPGYLEGREVIDVPLDSSAGGIEIILCKPNEGEDQLPMTALASILGPQLKGGVAHAFPAEAGHPEFIRGYEELMNRQNPAEAISLFNKSIERTPACMDCRLLLGLSLLHAGRWGSAQKHVEDVSAICDSLGVKKAELSLIKGVMEAWRGHTDEAAGLYRSALEADPQNSLALQELGRIAISQRNWEAAEQFLGNALRAGPSEESRILRVRALLELGRVEAASEEMTRYVAGRNMKDLPQMAKALNEWVHTQLSLLSKGKSKSLTSQPVEELVQSFPELEGLEFATDQSQLEEILSKIGQGVDSFFRSIPNTASLEMVHQERLKKDGKVITALDQEYQYIMLAQSGGPGLGIQEYRSTEDGNDAVRSGLKQGLMLTSGFASVSSIFHPVNRNGADFRYLGRKTLDGRQIQIVAFAQRPETAKMVTRFVIDDRSDLALVHGLAFVDAETFRIRRLHTYLLNPLPMVQLLKLATEIQYQEVAFDGHSVPLLLPREVEISVNWRGRYLHNRHTYSDFKLFNVESKEERKPVSAPPPPSESAGPDRVLDSGSTSGI